MYVWGDVIDGDRGDNQMGEMVETDDRQLIEMSDRLLVERGASQMSGMNDNRRDGSECSEEGWSRLGGHRGAGDDPIWGPGGAVSMGATYKWRPPWYPSMRMTTSYS